MFRDETPSADDLMIIMPDAFNNHRSTIQFVTNANGVPYDVLQNGESKATRNVNRDAVWNSRGSCSPEGWEL